VTENQPVKNYTDGYSYEVPRPFLTLDQAAAVLGKSLRALERGILGRWGNKLPDGWQARKMRISGGEEWRVIPPPGFRVRQILPGTTSDTISAYSVDESDESYESGAEEQVAFYADDSAAMTPAPESATQAQAQTQPQRRSQAQQAPRKRPTWRPERHVMDQPTIVIERTEEVEQLLRDMVTVQKALAEERRLHLEDLRLITSLQSSMRLLEADTHEKQRLQSELASTQAELNQVKQQYEQLLRMPWWRRMFFGQG